MNVLFLTIAKINSLEERGIYTDLLRKFRDEVHEVFIVCPTERRYQAPANLKEEKGVPMLPLIKLRSTRIQ